MSDPQARLPDRRRHVAVLGGMVVVLVVVMASHQQTRARAEHEREAQLQSELTSMRNAIRTYRGKHQTNPPSLDALVRDGELRAVPVDPFTSSSSTWRVTSEESVRVDDFQQGASHGQPTVTDVHSGAAGRDSNGRPFADY